MGTLGAAGPAEFHVHPQGGLGSGFRISEPSVTYLGRPLWANPEEGEIETVEVVGEHIAHGHHPVETARVAALALEVGSGHVKASQFGTDLPAGG